MRRQRFGSTRLLGWIASILILALGACGEPLVEPSVDESATGDAGFSPVASAVGPASGDFAECEEIISIDDFTEGLPPDLEIVNGRLQLRQGREIRPDMWVAGSSGMTRVNTETGAVVANYVAGDGASRTAVDLDFNVYVGNRWAGTVQKFNEACVCSDTGWCTNCQAWSRTFGNTPRGLAIDSQNHPWVGTWDNRQLYRLDPMTGATLRQYTLPSGVYGLAIDQQGLVWWASIGSGIGCFNPQTETTCGYFRIAGYYDAYGIAVDAVGNVWAGMWGAGGLGYIDRRSYEIARAAGLTLNETTVTTQRFTTTGTSQTRGVAVDGDGNIWVADSSSGMVHGFSPATGTFFRSINTTYNSSWCGPIGVAISENGIVWALCHSASRARGYRISDGAILYNIAVVTNPYSYSDFTGFALRNITAPTGVYRKVIDCGAEGCGFDWTDWDVVLPAGTNFTVQWRGSMDGVNWSTPSVPAAVAPHYTLPSGEIPRFLEVFLLFEANEEGDTPSVGSVEFWQCPRDLAPTDLNVDQRFINGPLDYGISWAFTDQSWPETYFEAVEPATGTSRCLLASQTSRRIGDRYEGGEPRPACREDGHPSNEPLVRAMRSLRMTSAGPIRSVVGATVTAYTHVNPPTVANQDLSFAAVGETDVTLRWCRPQRNVLAGLTGARLERSLTADFNPAGFGYREISTYADANRGYAPGGGSCGLLTDGGLSTNTTYYYRLTYRNGDGVESAPLVLSTLTFGGPCCYLGVCVGVCANGTLQPSGCEPPATWQDPELTCDGLDNDCDASIDEGLLNACGLCGPTPIEVCDGVDNDCNGLIDDNPVDGTTYYRDADGDTYGDPNVSLRACALPPGYVTIAGDCDDSNAATRPGVPDLCDTIDNDCDGRIDEDSPPPTWYRDADGDNFGVTGPGNTVVACNRPAGYAPVAGDCDDSRNVVYPGAPELCDLLDNNCDGITDEGFVQAAVQVISTSPLDVADLTANPCTNTFGGRICEGNAQVVVRITNLSTIAIPSAAQLSFHFDATSGPLIGGPMSIGAPVPVGATVTRAYCMASVTSATPRTVAVGLTADATLLCQSPNGNLPGQVFGRGAEICDGRDNDCDGATDENPESCGATLQCINDRGRYSCSGTLED